MTGHRRRRRPGKLYIIILVVAALALIPALAFAATGGGNALPAGTLAALTASPDCTLAVPAHPLTAQGLSTPYVLNSTAGTACAEDQNNGAFVQAIILNVHTGQLSVYDPEVVVPGETGAPVPPVPHLVHGDIVAIWTGFNDNELKLTGPGARQFVNFAQQGYDNSPQFFAALREDVREHLVRVPAIGTSTSDGMACPTTDDPSIVDQDPNDNVPVTYTYGSGASNGSDEMLLDLVLGSIGCKEWTVPLLDTGIAVGNGAGASTSGLLQEEQASVGQKNPLYVPGNDEFTTDDGNFVQSAANPQGDGQYDAYFNNVYRAQVGQPSASSNQTLAFCQALASRGEPRLAADAAVEAGQPAPDFAAIGTNLANVLAARYQATWGNLNCDGLTGDQSPIQVTVTGGIASSATYSAVPVPVTAAPTGTPTTTTPTMPATTAPTTPPAMAAGVISLVQESRSIKSDNPVVAGEGPLNSDSSGPAYPVFGQPVQAGDLLVMWGTVNDSNGGKFPLALTGNTAGWKLAGEAGGPYNWTGLWYQSNAIAGEALPKVADPAGGQGVSSDYLDTQAAEFSGAGSLDQAGSGTVADGTAVKTGGADAASDLVVAAATWNGSNLSPALSLSITGRSGQVLAGSVSSGAESADFANGSPFYAFGYATGSGTSGTTPDSATAQASQFENDAAVIVASFSPPAPGK